MAGNIKELTISIQQLKDFERNFDWKMSHPKLLDVYLYSAMVDAKDIELLNRLVKKKVGRPSKQMQQKVVFQSQNKYSLCSNDKSN